MEYNEALKMINVKANIINLKVNIKKNLNILHMDSICEEIKEDMHKQKKVSKKWIVTLY